MKKIAVTCGDPAGIGPEVVEKFLRERPEAASEILAIGPCSWLQKLPCDGVPVGDPDFKIVPAAPSAQACQIAWDALETAADLTRKHETAAVVTMPINKNNMQAIGFPFPGHTEFFAERWGGEATMAFAGGKLTVVLATWHTPLKSVPALITPQSLERSVTEADRLARALTRKAFPKIAVCGLNPHAGENGLLGDEEFEINKTLNQLRERFPNLSDCLPPDTVFWRQVQGEFDVVVALYHDQALGPVKTLEFDKAVNCTLGLPFVRTSPDHGTAYNIAGKGIAKTDSLENALRVAEKLAKFTV
ncbi:MAG: 4-hydroxythreonine-4-phosphate dehydrogenase PdxA [Opitutales bacterium]|nr:4-hydroxythreonine-4-phosphate dehydrogenase PdxA [Opitutales bacterium]